MSTKTYVMVECNTCGSVDYYQPPRVNQQAKEIGWIVLKNDRHYCNPSCQKKDTHDPYP